MKSLKTLAADLSRRFLAEDDGAVTVDWVVLTAAIVGLGIAVGSAMWDNTQAVTETIGATMSKHVSNTSF